MKKILFIAVFVLSISASAQNTVFPILNTLTNSPEFVSANVVMSYDGRRNVIVANATVPHIVALLGFSFHVAKIRQVSETSKLYGGIFIAIEIVHFVRLDNIVRLFHIGLFSLKCPKMPENRHLEFS